jgi:hypothetical protein
MLPGQAGQHEVDVRNRFLFFEEHPDYCLGFGGTGSFFVYDGIIVDTVALAVEFFQLGIVAKQFAPFAGQGKPVFTCGIPYSDG